MISIKAMVKSIFITPGGIKGIHNPLMDKLIPKMGKATVERASTVEFDNDKQTWKAVIKYDGKEFYSDVREEVLEMEEKYINEAIRRGLI